MTIRDLPWTRLHCEYHYGRTYDSLRARLLECTVSTALVTETANAMQMRNGQAIQLLLPR